MSVGKLYKFGSDEFIVEVNYQFYDKSPTNLRGELAFTEYRWVHDGAGYVIELEDSRKCQCYLKRRVNRAVTGVPPRYVYHFTATS